MSPRVRIAMLDSGVSLPHPHIQRPVQGGVTLLPDGSEQAGFNDRLGHGTAVCALLQAMAPEADVYAVRIFDQRLATNLSMVLRAIRWCIEQKIDIINLSLGTTNAAHEPQFRQVIEEATDAGAVLVSAYETNGTCMLPGSMSGVLGAVEDSMCPRNEVRVLPGSLLGFATCPYPLDIDGVPRERNIHGVSFSVAHLSAHVANLWHRRGEADWAELLRTPATAEG